jgi:hypothetical protein
MGSGPELLVVFSITFINEPFTNENRFFFQNALPLQPNICSLTQKIVHPVMGHFSL